MQHLPNSQGSKYMTTVRIGPRGQMVIPKEARQLLGLRPGDSVLLLADPHKGIALQPMENCQEVLSQLFPAQDAT